MQLHQGCTYLTYSERKLHLYAGNTWPQGKPRLLFFFLFCCRLFCFAFVFLVLVSLLLLFSSKHFCVHCCVSACVSFVSPLPFYFGIRSASLHYCMCVYMCSMLPSMFCRNSHLYSIWNNQKLT